MSAAHLEIIQEIVMTRLAEKSNLYLYATSGPTIAKKAIQALLCILWARFLKNKAFLLSLMLLFGYTYTG